MGPSPPRLPLILTLGALALFATGVNDRPAGDGWTDLYDLVLYNAVYVGALLVCALAARRVRADRLAWTAMALAIGVGLAGNVVYTLFVATMEDEPFPSIADVF